MTTRDHDDHAAPARAAAEGAPGRWARARPLLLDIAAPLALFCYSLPFLPVYLPDPALFAAAAAILLCLCTPYVLRRRHPLGVFAVILLAAWAQPVIGVDVLAADLMLAFALYNVASRYEWRVSAPAAAAVVLWLLAAFAPRLDAYYLSVGDLGLFIVVAVWAWTWGTLVRIRRAQVAALRERALQAERERAAQAAVAAAAERARIAREIHDVVSHGLSAVVLLAEGASLKVRSEPERAEQAMRTVRDTGRTALAEMRRMLDVLHTNGPDAHGPRPGIDRLGLLAAESRAAGTPAVLTVAGRPEPLSEERGLAVYRVVQEALTNARKHGGTDLREVAVALRYRPGELEVRVTDDGPGAPAPTGEGGHGLAGMRERVAACGGTLRAGPREGGGFDVVAVLPIGGDG